MKPCKRPEYISFLSRNISIILRTKRQGYHRSVPDIDRMAKLVRLEGAKRVYDRRNYVHPGKYRKGVCRDVKWMIHVESLKDRSPARFLFVSTPSFYLFIFPLFFLYLIPFSFSSFLLILSFSFLLLILSLSFFLSLSLFISLFLFISSPPLRLYFSPLTFSPFCFSFSCFSKTRDTHTHTQISPRT